MLAGGFSPEITATAPFNTDFAAFLVRQGHSVDVVTHFPNYPQWRRYPDYRGRLTMMEDVQGARVRRVTSYIPKDPSPLRRIGFDTAFAGAALVGASTFRRDRPDIVFAVCSPLQVGLSAALLKRRWGVPFVLHLQDLIPESATEVSMLRNARVVAAAHRLADIVYGQADLISAIGKGFLETLRNRAVPNAKLAYFPNWVDVDRITAGSRDNEFRRSLGISSDCIIVLYVGNVGFKQGLSTVIDAAHRLRNDLRFRFVLVGEGSDLATVKARSVELEVENVVFLGVQPQERLAEMLAAGDVLIVHQRSDVVEMVVPSKLLVYSSASRPIVFAGSVESEGARFIKASGGGVIVPGEDPAAMAEALRAFADDPERGKRQGQLGRTFVDRNYRRDEILAQGERMLASLVEAVPVAALR